MDHYWKPVAIVSVGINCALIYLLTHIPKGPHFIEINII